MKKLIDNSRGFTLVEILLSLIVLALICMGIAGVFKQFFKADTYVMGTLNIARDGKTAMNMIAEELKYAAKVISTSGNVITFRYYQDPNTLVRKIFLKDNCLYLNNGSGDILITQNVNNIQFEKVNVNKDKPIISIKATLYDSKSKSNYQINTTVNLMNYQEE